MTRFARAKGSKASNERVPEEATSWDEMKRQLLEKNKELEQNKKRKDAFETRNANYKAFLEEKEKEDEGSATWAEFPGASFSTSPVKGNKKNKKYIDCVDKSTPNQKDTDNTTNNGESDNDDPPDEMSSKTEIPQQIIAKKKIKSKKPLKITLEQEEKTKSDDHQENIKPAKKRKSSNNEVGVRKKLRKENNIDSSKNNENPNNKQKKKIVNENLSEKDLKKIEKKKQKRIKQLEKKKKVKAELKRQKEAEMSSLTPSKENSVTGVTEIQNPLKSLDKSPNKTTYPKKPDGKANFTKKQRSKVKNNDEHPRKKPLLPHKMFINGKKLEIEYVDGFPVKKEDALRLKKLRREMISKGLPRSEINAALKLERRKAEKAFAREKKKVCFHCRKSGHNLSECPDFDKNEVAQTAASGICFKCGSTEHTHFECKVVRGQEFKYATCFICNEQGHIARQCPDNARGLYPKGGACKVWGDVTHLKKDCPKYQAQQQKQEENLRIGTVGNSNPDILEEKNDTGGPVHSSRANKIIKF